jgi:cytosine/adenosine deaminase-related metal-dependent hydrolase
MPAWTARLIDLRRGMASGGAAAIADAIAEVGASGTSLLGEVANTLESYELLADSSLSACVFHELLGFNVADPAAMVADAQRRLGELTPNPRLRPSIVAHAPYSVSPQLFAAIASASCERVMSIHVGESDDEMRFLREGAGAWRALLDDLHAWNPGWTPPGCGPVEYLDRLGLINDRLLAVHAVQLDDRELDRLAAAGATVVTCPRSNRWTGAGTPPIERFYASGVRVAIGTDSLASADDLSVFSELREARAAAPGVAASRLLESATRSGAAALRFGEELGTIERGKRAELIAVRIPEELGDVEEYLLSGIGRDSIRWLEPG